MRANTRERLLDSVFLLALLGVALAAGIPHIRSDFWYPDASRHAMDGVFLKDFFEEFAGRFVREAASPAAAPERLVEKSTRLLELASEAKAWAVRYYFHYPALGLIYYPPLFPLVEACFFSLFGISAAVARATVLSLTVAAFWLFYLCVRNYRSPVEAFVPVLLFATSPAVLKWSHDAMLELPAFAVCFGSLLFAIKFAQLGRKRDALAAALLGSLALYMKQTTLFVGIALITWAVVGWLAAKQERRANQFQSRRRHVLMGCALYLIIALPLAAVTIYFGGVNVAQSIGGLGQFSRLSFANWLFYPRVVPKLIGWWMVPLFLLGLTISLRRPLSSGRAPFLIWLISCYVLFSLISQKSSRLGIFLTAPLCFCAGESVNWLRCKASRRSIKNLFVGAVCAAAAFGLWREAPFVYGYEAAASFVLQRAENYPIIFFQGKYNGNFIFHVRRLDQDREHYVIRGSKVLTSINLMKEFGYSERAGSPEEVLNILRHLGVKYVVIEDEDLEGIRVFEVLREVLAGDQFERLDSFDVESNLEELAGARLLVYEFEGEVQPSGELLEIELGPIGLKISSQITAEEKR